MARVHVDAWRFAYSHILPVAKLEAEGDRGFSYEKRTEMWRKTLGGIHRTFVAIDGDEVLGFASGGANHVPEVPCDGELLAIYVHPSAHRKGVGRALLKVVVDDLISSGYASMSVWLFRDNHEAKAFYIAHGAEFFCESVYAVGGVTYPDEALIWKSLADLRCRLS